MLWVRKSILLLLTVVLFGSLLGIANSLNLNQTLGKPDKVKQLLSDSGVYDHVVSAALNHAQEEALKQGEDTTVALNSTVVMQAANQAFPSQLLERNTDTFIDANYAWLSGKTTQPEFSIDLSDARAQFIALTTEYVTNRLAKLPVCSAEQLARIQLPVDPLLVTCLPTGLDPQTEGQRIGQHISNSDFLSKPVITANSFGRDEQSQDKPYYERYDRAPDAYKFAQKAPLILAVVALVSALLMLLVAPTHRRGLRRVGFVLLVAGLLLAGYKFFAQFVTDKLIASMDDTVTTQLQRPRDDFLRHLEAAVVQTNLICGIIFIVLAALIFGWLIKTRGQNSAPTPKYTPATPGDQIAPTPATAPPQPRPNPLTALRPAASRRQQPMDVMGLSRPRPSQPSSSSSAPTAPGAKRPPKPRRPRLIQ